MDISDIRLIGQLLHDSRTPYRELADNLGLSVQAVHRRIQVLVEAGVIKRFTAHLSVPYLGAVPVYISGVSASNSLDAVLEKLRAGDRVELAATSGGNMIFTRSLLRGISELERHIEFVKSAAAVANPLPVGIEGVNQVGDRAAVRAPKRLIELTTLDYRLVDVLHGDSRLAVADIADKLGVSAKTVSRRLDRLTEAGAVEFTLQVQLGAASGTTALVLFALKPGVDKNLVRKSLNDRFGTSIVMLTTYSNLPDKLFFMCWAQTTVNINEMVEAVSKDESVLGVRSYVLYNAYWFDTWRDRVLAGKAGPEGKGS
jgi:Lrp/AsnC family leucine-responsive transcriptional regulator